MASWIKTWKRKHAKEAEYAISNNISLVRHFGGQLSYMCESCGAWWSVKDGVTHDCPRKEAERNVLVS